MNARSVVLTLLVLILGSFGCPSKKEPPPEPARPEQKVAPAGPGAPLELNKPDEARVRLDLNAARDAIRKKKEIDGSYPASLGELGLSLNFPGDLTYDPQTGTVKSKTYPMF